MIPSHWMPHVRPDDGELLGYLVAAGDHDTVTPVTVFGYPLGHPSPRAAAESRLEQVGLSYLADRWALELPDREEPIRVEIVEATPELLTVQSVDFGYEADYGTRITLDVPVTHGLHRA
ncbi:MAG: hypothetical protein H0W01_17450 [Pseudonocardiales bacterium]|nr:hypothetical protein [Pseudonocardiales bacterium]